MPSEPTFASSAVLPTSSPAALSTDSISLNPNPLVRALGKPAEEFTRADIARFIADEGITMLNLRYVGDDGRLKELNFAIQSAAHLDRVLTMGERVDGSSLFDVVEATSSDLYVVPQLRTAHLNPFAALPALDIMCGFYDVEGSPLASAPPSRSCAGPRRPWRPRPAAAWRRSASSSTTCSPRPTPSSRSRSSAATTRPPPSPSGRRSAPRPCGTWRAWAARSSTPTPRSATS